ncbi:albumin-1-like [Trifolium pratense]|uniref:albumin-1-like n=1 Tax=Trifolium pratense TaxID=57577 RepID=UPI001E69286C|nr:albumin-1-like [Trifolium pratense]
MTLFNDVAYNDIAIVTFPIKKVEAICGELCSINVPCPKSACGFCTPQGYIGVCIPGSYKDAMKMVGENFICQNDAECKNKGSRNVCVRFPKADVEYGVCADSISEAENLIFKDFL